MVGFKVFIDSNIVVDWLLIRRVGFRRKVRRGLLQKRLEKMYDSYLLVQGVLNQQYPDVTFITSILAINEVFHAIHEEQLYKKLYLEGAPFVTWPRYRDSVELGEEEESELLDYVLDNINDLFKEDLIKLVDDHNDDLELCAYITVKFRLRTQDAILVATALQENCNYFTTRDTDLLDGVQRRRSEPWQELLNKLRSSLRFVTPKELLTRLTK